MAWPQVKPKDGSALSKFAIFLSSCKNALSSSLYASKFDQPGNLQNLVFKLPFSMRERWRRSANDIMELQSRPVKFDDLVPFVDREARIATNPAFGNILSFAQSGSGSARRPLQSHAGPASSKVKTSTFVTQVQNNRHTNPEQNSDADPVVLGSQSVTCPFCQKSHALEDWRFLRWKPYQEPIKFLSSMRLCFGCLSDNHVARLCPQHKGRYTRGSLLLQHAPATRSRSKAPSSAPTISSKKICCATKLLLPRFAPSYQTGLI